MDDVTRYLNAAVDGCVDLIQGLELAERFRINPADLVQGLNEWLARTGVDARVSPPEIRLQNDISGEQDELDLLIKEAERNIRRDVNELFHRACARFDDDADSRARLRRVDDAFRAAVDAIADDDGAGQVNWLQPPLRTLMDAVNVCLNQLGSGTLPAVFADGRPFTRIQRRIMVKLDGAALIADALMNAFQCGREHLFGKKGAGGIKELSEHGFVINDRTIGGYYRPDRPPKLRK